MSNLNELNDIITVVRNMPVTMFEAKPQRVVGFDEIKSVILPSNSSEELKNALSKRNIPYEEYEEGNNQKRKDILNSHDEVKFSKKNGIIVSTDNKGVTVFRGYEFGKKNFRTNDEYEGYVKGFVEHTLEQMIGKPFTIKADRRSVEIGEDMPHEYVSSKDTYKRFGQNRQAKMSAISGIEEIIVNATIPDPNKKKFWVANTEEKHSVDTKRGWLNYQVYMGFENPAGTTFFEGYLKVRMDANGKDYVYDITDIKKVNYTSIAISKTNASSESNSQFVDNIPQKKLGINTKNEKKDNDIKKSLKDSGIKYSEKEALENEQRESELEKETTNEVASILEEGFEALKENSKLEFSDSLIRTIAERYIKQYKSNYKVSDFAKGMKAVFAYIRDHEVNYEDMVRVILNDPPKMVHRSTDLTFSNKDDNL